MNDKMCIDMGDSNMSTEEIVENLKAFISLSPEERGKILSSIGTKPKKQECKVAKLKALLEREQLIAELLDSLSNAMKMDAHLVNAITSMGGGDQGFTVAAKERGNSIRQMANELNKLADEMDAYLV